MIPVLEALQALLVSNDDIAEAVDDGDGGHRIFGPRRTMPELTPPLPKTIVLQRVGGPVLMPQTRPRTYVRCYADNVGEAEALYRLLYPVFYTEHGVARGPQTVDARWLLYWGQLTEPVTTIEPDSGWPVASGTLDSLWAVYELAA